MRTAEIKRETAETKIELTLNLDGAGRAQIESGCGFLDHMLTLFAFHGGFDLTLRCAGDTQVDDHHTLEDIAIALGRAFDQALFDRRGIARYGSFLLPMDESLVLCALDISGRACVAFDLPLAVEKIGSFDTQLVKEFFLGFSRALGATIHIKLLSGENAHHIVEAAFKGFGRSMRAAVAIDPARAEQIPSSKGTIV